MQYFRHFIYVNLGILVALYKNVLFEHSGIKKQFARKFFCPTLGISMSGSPIIQDGKLWAR